MSSVPRIVILDPARELAPVVRGALALLNRQHILVEVPTADDVLDEVQHRSINLIVTAYRIPGAADGIALARAVGETAPDVPVIVLADQSDRPLDPSALAGEPFQYYCRPDAEAFVRGVRAALDGEPVEPEPAFVPVPDEARGPAPPVDARALRGVVAGVMRDVGAVGALLADRNGRVLIDEGATRYINPRALAGLLAPSFARLSDLSGLVGARPWALHYYDGTRVDVFALALGLHHFMCLIVDGGNRSAMGAVTIYGRRAADQIIELIGEAAYSVTGEEALPPADVYEPGAESSDGEPERHASAPSGDGTEADALLTDQAALADFDPDALFGQPVDENLADSLFSLERLADIVATLEPDDDEHVDYRQARDLGLLDE